MIEAAAILVGVLVTFAFHFLLFTNPPKPRRKRQ